MNPIRVIHQYNDGERIVIKLSDGSEAVARNWNESVKLAGRIVNGEFEHLKYREVERVR